MKVTITNKASYAREVQYFRRNQFVVLQPRTSMVVEDIHDALEIAYYESLRSHGFEVCFHKEEQQNDFCVEGDSCLCDEVGVKHQESSEEDSVSAIDLSGFSNDDLKRIIKNLGIDASRVRARWKLERYVLENLPRDASLENYL